MNDRVSPWPKPDKSVNAKQRVLGDYVIERELGRGGMGVVWLATQSSLDRKVALKVLPNFATMDMDAVMRFRREAEATGRLAHPGIVPVYGVGEVDGIPYFAMEYIEGPTLGSILEALSMCQVDRLRGALVDEAQIADRYPSMREPPATGAGNRYVRSCARLCADVANALAAAHKAGVIHRDLKPNNILIHPAGRPVLVDFGLARDEQAGHLTRIGEPIGTPAYMAPEQARGSRDVDARVDVYGLGVVLYELLALRPLFEGSTTAEIAHRILTEDPVPVRRHNPNVPVDLAAILHRCLAKSPDHRYPTIEAVESDLRSFLAGAAVTAQLPSWFVRMQGALQRQRKSLTIGGSAALAALALAITAGVVDDRADRADGRRTLDEAGRALVERLEIDEANRLYAQAEALTKDPVGVSRRRLEDFRRAFEHHYAQKPEGPAELRKFSRVFGADDRRVVQGLLDRLDGRGTLRYSSQSIEQRTRLLEERRVTADGLEPEWRAIAVGELLPVGERLLRATSQEGVRAFVYADVSADETVSVEPRYVPSDELPPDHAAVVDDRTGQTIAICQYEVTRGEWARWLKTISDPVLRAEMTPSGWDGGQERPDVPVHGLSFFQARAFAASHEAHLPSAREQWLAGSAGLKQLLYPWGAEADVSRLAADPFQLSGPEPVRSRAEGSSPLGVNHVLGNVAELLSVGPDGVLQMGGGSYLDDPNLLRLLPPDSVPTESLRSLLQRHPGAGARLYRFVAAPEDTAAHELARMRTEELRRQRTSELTSWVLRRDGRLQCETEIREVHTGQGRSRYVTFDTPGFLQVAGSVQVLDGEREELPGRAVLARQGESSGVITEIASLEAGQASTFFLTAELQPVGGMLPHRDSYVLRLPMKRGVFARIYKLTLPPDCSVEEVSPAAAQWTEQGCTVLMWEPTSTAMIETAVVRFRADGMFGTQLGSMEKARERVVRLLKGMSAPNQVLEPFLDEDFLRQPGALNRRGVLAGRGDERINLVDVIDTVRIGEIETTEVLVDWVMDGRDGAAFELQAWPMLVQWRWQGDRARAVRLQPHTMTDSGSYTADGGYEHEKMRIRIRPIPGTGLSRTQDELCPLQVKLEHEGFDMMVGQVLGYMDLQGESPESIRFRLTNGASVLRPGELLSSHMLGSYLVQDWLFGRGEVWERERWFFQQLGSRHVFCRFVATDSSRMAATQLFADPSHLAWIQQVLDAVEPQ